MLHIEVTPEEAAILEKALDTYQNEPAQAAMLSTMIEAAVGLSNGKRMEDTEKSAKAKIAVAEVEMTKRKRSVLRLKLRLMDAIENPAEFDTGLSPQK